MVLGGLIGKRRGTGWLNRETLLKIEHFNFMGLAILLDNPTHECNSLVAKSAHQMKIYLYTPNPILASRMWPCYLRPNSTDVTYFGLCLLNSSLSNPAAH